MFAVGVQVTIAKGTGPPAGDASSPAYLVGHGGEDWGSGGSLVGYNPHHGVGFVVAMGSNTGASQFGLG